MGRIGVSEYQVFQAADRLVADGVKPSVDTVRQELGNTGSRTTINKYLKSWRERQAQREHAGVNLSDHLLQVLREQSEIILLAIESTAQAKFEAKSREHEAAVEQQRQRLSEQDAEVARCRTQLAELDDIRVQQLSVLQQQQAQLTDAREDNQSLRERLAKETGRRETLEGAMTEQDRQLGAIQKELKTIQNRHEILTEAHATKAAELHRLQQREREQCQLVTERNAEIKRLHRELRTAKQRGEKDMSRLMTSVRQLAKSQRTQRATRRKPAANNG
ncbi:MAG: DNA-binding protein [Gammaproteobacteria bacterium]|nr:DNA-binding protein [Gammaproteobacteria bacterium]